MRTLVFAPSGAQVWIFLIRRTARTACAISSGSFRHGAVKTKGMPLMTYRTASAAAKTSVLSTLAMVALALSVGPHAFAQQPPTNPPVPPAQGETVHNGQQQLQLISSPWTRYCAKGLTEQSSELRTKEVCFTGRPSGIRPKALYCPADRAGGGRYEAVTRHAALGRGASPGRPHCYRRERGDDCAIYCLPAQKWLHGGLQSRH